MTRKLALAMALTIAAAGQAAALGDMAVVGESADVGQLQPTLWTTVRIDIGDRVAVTRLVQAFANGSDSDVNAVYSLDLPAGATIVHLEVSSGCAPVFEECSTLTELCQTTAVRSHHGHALRTDGPQNAIENGTRLVLGYGKAGLVDHRPNQLAIQITSALEADTDSFHAFRDLGEVLRRGDGQRIPSFTTPPTSS